MAFAWGSAAQGAVGAMDQIQERTMRDLQIQAQRQALAESLRQQAGQAAGQRWWENAGNLQQFTGQQPAAQPPQIPPMPGQSSQPQQPPAGGPPPGGPPQIQMPPPQAMAQAQPPGMQPQPPMPPGAPQMPGPGGPPQMPPPPMSAGAPPGAGPRPPGGNGISPYMAPQPMPQAGGPRPGMPGQPPQIGAPPSQAGQPANDSLATPPAPGSVESWNVPAMLQSMQKAGVPFDVAMGMVKQFEAAMSPEQKAQAAMLKAQKDWFDADTRRKAEEDKAKLNQAREIQMQYQKDKIIAQTEELRTRSQAEQERIREGKIKVQAGPGGAPVPGVSGLTADAVEMDAYNRLFNGKYPPGYQKDNRMRIQIDNQAADLAKRAGLTMAEVAVLPGEKKADLVSLNNMTRWYDGVKKSSMAVENNIKIMKSYDAQVDLTQYQDINAAKVAIKAKLGDVAAQNYENAAMEVMNEYARVMSGPTSNAQLAEGASKRAQEILNTSFSPQQLDGAQEVMTKIMNGQLKATEDTIADRKSDLKSLGSGSRSSSGSSKPAGPVKITGDAEYNALQSGTQFVGPDGVTRTKP